MWLWEQFEKGDSILLVVLIFVCAILIGIPIGLSKKKGAWCVQKATPCKEWSYYLQRFRNRNYFTVKNGDAKLESVSSTCMVTFWSASHIFLYAILGFCVPKLFFPIFLMGVVWELSETLLGWQCGLDLICNLLGFTIGYGLRQWLVPLEDGYYL